MAAKHKLVTQQQVLLVQLAFTFLASLAGVIDGGATSSTTHLRFFMHDTVTGNPATAVHVARGAAPLPGDPVNHFGDVYVIDDPLTDGPDAASPAVGRAQGFYLFASRSDQALLLCANMVFTAPGKHGGGGSITVMARDAILDKVRELPVIGGTGRFRGAVGYGLLTTHSYNASTNNAVLQVDMYLNLNV